MTFSERGAITQFRIYLPVSNLIFYIVSVIGKYGLLNVIYFLPDK